MRTINVDGFSKMSVKPTLMTISLELSGKTKTFDEAVNKSTSETEIFKDSIEKLGYKRSDLKTKQLDIDTRTESYKDRDDKYRSRFAGYQYTHKMFIEFPEDNKRLGEILTALVRSEIEFEFSVAYTISDAEKKKYMEQIISEAVCDAKRQAMILARAAKVELGDIVTINHTERIGGSINDDFMRSESLDYMEQACMMPDIEFSIDAKDIVLSDEVNMIWEIK